MGGKLRDSAAYYRERRRRMAAEGRCAQCEKPNPDKEFIECSACRERKRAYYHANKGRIAEWHKKYAQKPDVIARRNERARVRTREEKKRVMDHYGSICACCGEDRLEFLTLDHINGNGSAHRLELMGHPHHSGYKFYVKLRQLGYPEGLRTLCSNCNTSLGFYGYCPHNRDFR